MAKSEDILNNFMNQQNKEFVGEISKNGGTAEIKGNELPEIQKPQHYDADFSSSGNDRLYLAARKTISSILTIPILICGLLSFVYILLNLLPLVIEYTRKLFILLLV